MTTAKTSKQPRSRAFLQGHWMTRNVQTISIVMIFVGLVIVFSLLNPYFFTGYNLANAARQIAPTVIAAVTMTFVITTAGIDLSIGSLLAVSGASLGIFALDMNPLLALLLVLLIGLASGTVVGYLSAYQGIAAFIVTLAGLTALRGLAELITGGYSTPIDAPLLTFLGQGKIASVYTPIWIAVVVVTIGWYVYSHTRFGRYVKAVGSNEESARRVGINTRRVKMTALAFSGLTAAIAGILVSTRLGSGSSNVGVAFELEVITAVVLGGTNLFGGRGSIIGALFGALTLGVLSNGLVIIGLNVFWVPILQGVILLLAILANTKIFSRIGHTT